MTSPFATLTRSELRVAARDGEQLLLTAGLPIVLLVLFGLVDVLPTGDMEPLDFLVPGILTMALLSSGFVRLAIALGFDRSFGAIERYAVSPVRVTDFLGSRAAVAALIGVVQVGVLFTIGVALGWRPTIHVLLPAVIVLAMLCFFGLGLTLGSLAQGLRTLALANALYILLLLFSGLVFDLAELPAALAAVARLLPTSATADLVRSTTIGEAGDARAWLVLAAWSVIGPVAAVRWFRWR